jgi:hypothetical protein
MDDYICKPAPVERMVQMIRKWVPPERLGSQAAEGADFQ